MLPTLFLFIAVTAFAQQSQYDLILKGGHVIDAKNGVDAVRDVAIRGGRIAAGGAQLSARAAEKNIYVAGFFGAPRFVDFYFSLVLGNRRHGSADGAPNAQ